MKLSRRRFLTIAAGSAVLLLAGRAHADALVHWRGTALGAEAEMLLPGPGAGAAIDAALAEIDRLEGILSLYRPDSALCRLNRDGHLRAPPLELVEVLAHAEAVSRLTGGAFDITVQPLWDAAAQGRGVTAQDLALVDWRAVEVSPAAVRLLRPGMRLTLNGIAQGYVTDRVADLLRRRGLGPVLVDLGEARAVGRHPDGRPWRVAPGAGSEALELDDGMAVATSVPAGDGPNVLDPGTGAPAALWEAVTVRAAGAMHADALSTALCLLDEASVRRVHAEAGVQAAWLRRRSGPPLVLSDDQS